MRSKCPIRYTDCTIWDTASRLIIDEDGSRLTGLFFYPGRWEPTQQGKPMKKRSAVLLVVSALLVGWISAQVSCNGQNLSDNVDGGADGGDLPPLFGLVSLSVTPATATLSVDNVGGPQTQAYQAIGHLTVSPTAMSPIRSTGASTTPRLAASGAEVCSPRRTRRAGRASSPPTFGHDHRHGADPGQSQPVVKSTSAPADAATKAAAGRDRHGDDWELADAALSSNNTMFPRNI